MDEDYYMVPIYILLMLLGVCAGAWAETHNNTAVMTIQSANAVCSQLMNNSDYVWYDHDFMADKKFYCKNTKDIEEEIIMWD